MIFVILASSLLNLSAAPAADIPSKMLDNIYLDALTYTGYKTDVQKADGSIFKTYSGNACLLYTSPYPTAKEFSPLNRVQGNYL